MVEDDETALDSSRLSLLKMTDDELRFTSLLELEVIFEELLDSATLESLDDRLHEELLDRFSVEDEDSSAGSQILSPEHAVKLAANAAIPTAASARKFFNSQIIIQTFPYKVINRLVLPAERVQSHQLLLVSL